jgi:hypothetical protein
MNRRTQITAGFFCSSLGGALLLISGCHQSLSPEAYLKAYAEEAQTISSAGEFEVTAMALTPEYLTARFTPSNSDRKAYEAAFVGFSKANYVSVQIELAHPTGTSEDLRHDFVNSAMLGGEEVFQRRLSFLESDVGAFVRLKCKDGRQVAPVSYRFNRGTGFPGVHTFLFLFPKDDGGQSVLISGSRLILKNVGLSPETLELPLRISKHFSLKL